MLPVRPLLRSLRASRLVFLFQPRDVLRRPIAVAGLGSSSNTVTRARIGGADLCHEDLMFSNGRWAFAANRAERNRIWSGTASASATCFFSLAYSRGSTGRDRHHRIFGYLEIDELRRLDGRPSKSDSPKGFLPATSAHHRTMEREQHALSRLWGQSEECAPLSASHQGVLRFQSGTFRHGLRRSG